MPSPISNPVELALDDLITYLKTQIAATAFIRDFPNRNEALVMPSITVTHNTDGAYESLDPYELSISTPVGDSAAVTVIWIVGQWDFKVQLDLWAASKPARDKLFSDVYRAINKQIHPMGLSLPLPSYYGLFARFDINGFSHIDNEQAAQRQEWRTKIDLLANLKQAQEESAFIITKPIAVTAIIPDNGVEIQ